MLSTINLVIYIYMNTTTIMYQVYIKTNNTINRYSKIEEMQVLYLYFKINIRKTMLYCNYIRCT